MNDVEKAFKSKRVEDFGPGSSVHSIKKIHRHPKTSAREKTAETYNYDFVLLELVEPIKFGMKTGPLFLADPGDRESWTITTPFISMLTIVFIQMCHLV